MKYRVVLILLFFQFCFVAPSIFAAEWKVCPSDSTDATCSHKGPAGLQQAINEAVDGDTVLVNGKYTYDEGESFQARAGITQCAVDLKGKNITLKGQGAQLYGQGHDPGKAYKYGSRAAICSVGGSITIDSMDVKEFEGGGLYFEEAQVIIKNSMIQGNDHGGIFLVNSTLLAVNNSFVTTNISIIPSGSSSIKATNNTFFHSKSMVSACQQDIPPLEFSNNIVVDKELTLGVGGINPEPECRVVVQQFKDKKIENNIFWKNNEYEWFPDHEFNSTTNGNLQVDPQIDASVEQRGLMSGTLDPKAPEAVGKGLTSGPCASGTSAICTDYIKNNPPPAVQNPPDPPGPDDNMPPDKDDDTRYIHQYAMDPISKETNNTAGLFLYILLAIVYIMTIHLAIAIGDQFNIFLMAGIFVFGGVVGFFLQSYELGFVLAIILSLIFW